MEKKINESLPIEQRLGQVGVNNQGEKITIIRYENSKNIDVQFEDGTIVYNRNYANFIKGKIKYPIEDRVGKTNYNSQGLKMTIIAYRKVSDIDVQFEDGTIVYNRSYGSFKKGMIAYPIEDRVGETNYNSQGLKMTIIAYRGYKDIDIEFEDGTIVYNRSYYDFQNSKVKYPIKDRVGEIGYNNKGEKMIIVAYRNSCDIDIQFEDGSIVYNKSYANFKIGNIRHFIIYEESFAYHIEIELGLNLNDIWNWEKNNKNGINPYEIKKQSNKKVWLYCQEHDYHNDFGGYEMTCADFYKGHRCSYCAKKKVHYKDSLAYNYPQIAKMVAIKENNLTFEDCCKIACNSGKEFYFKCLDCNEISKRKIELYRVIKYGYSCKFCSDGLSIPNKFAYNLLTQLRINFKSEYSPYYFRNTQHADFLLTDFNMILEMDGNYGNHTREYDYWRDFLNMKYGGYKTIRIDLTNDNRYKKDAFNYIKEQIINSELSNIFNLNNIDWKLAWEESQSSLCIKSWKLWNNGIHDVKKISEILNLDKSTAIIYLKRGVECNKCNYTIEESRKNGHKKNEIKVICITTNEIFDSIKKGAKKYKIKNPTGITSCCKGKYNYCGKLEDGTPLKWMYYEDYLKMKELEEK